MGELMNWMLMAMAILVSVALALLNAWLLLDMLLTSLSRGSTFKEKVDLPLGNKNPRD